MARDALILRHPSLRRLYAVWLQHCANETLPMAPDFQAAELRPWLDNLSIIDIVEDWDFVYAFCGRSYGAAFDRDLIGKSIRISMRAADDPLMVECARVRDERLPASHIFSVRLDRFTTHWERLVMPLFGIDGAVEKLMLATYQLPR